MREFTSKICLVTVWKRMLFCVLLKSMNQSWPSEFVRKQSSIEWVPMYSLVLFSSFHLRQMTIMMVAAVVDSQTTTTMMINAMVVVVR